MAIGHWHRVISTDVNVDVALMFHLTHFKICFTGLQAEVGFPQYLQAEVGFPQYFRKGGAKVYTEL